MKAAKERWDRLGVWASTACAIHCLVAPLLFLAAPTFAGIWAHPSAHAIVAVLVLPLAGSVLFRGYRKHRRLWVALAAGIGAACIVIGCILPFVEPGAVTAASETAAVPHDNCCPQVLEDESGSTTLSWPPASIVTILGSVLLVASHLGNLTCCRSCDATA